MTLKHSGKGDRKAQRKRRKDRWKNIPLRQNEPFELIDGNFSHYPVGECSRYGAFLTQGLMDTHRCIERDCSRFRKLVDDDQDK